MNISMIDMIKYSSVSMHDRIKFGKHIVNLFKENGFLILQNSYVSMERQNYLFNIIDKFFSNLTEEIKEEIKYNKQTNRGFAGIAAESLDENAFDVKETYNIGLINTSIKNILTTDKNYQEINKDLLEHAETCFKNIQDLLRALALGCDLNEDFFVKRHNRDAQTLRLLHYPVINNTNNIKYAVSPHTDYGTLTMVLQDHNLGLSVQDLETSKWHQVHIDPGCAVINIGDLLMRWSNNILKSNPHKVDYVNGKKSRYMTAFFAHPSYEEQISCLNHFKQGKVHYEPINSLDYLNMRLSSTYK